MITVRLAAVNRDHAISRAWDDFCVEVARAIDSGTRQVDIARDLSVTRETVRLWTKRGRSLMT